MTPQLFSILVGLVMPFAVTFVRSLLKGNDWDHRLAWLFAFGSSVLVGFVSSYLSGQLDWSNWLQSTAYGFAAAQGVYSLWFKPSGTDQKVANLVPGQ